MQPADALLPKALLHDRQRARGHLCAKLTAGRRPARAPCTQLHCARERARLVQPSPISPTSSILPVRRQKPACGQALRLCVRHPHRIWPLAVATFRVGSSDSLLCKHSGVGVHQTTHVRHMFMGKCNKNHAKQSMQRWLNSAPGRSLPAACHPACAAGASWSAGLPGGSQLGAAAGLASLEVLVGL